MTGAGVGGTAGVTVGLGSEPGAGTTGVGGTAGVIGGSPGGGKLSIGAVGALEAAVALDAAAADTLADGATSASTEGSLSPFK